MMVEIGIKEVELGEVESALNTYRFINNDLGQGLDYMVDKSLANKSLAAIGSVYTFDSSIKGSVFVARFYDEYKKYKAKNKY